MRTPPWMHRVASPRSSAAVRHWSMIGQRAHLAWACAIWVMLGPTVLTGKNRSGSASHGSGARRYAETGTGVAPSVRWRVWLGAAGRPGFDLPTPMRGVLLAGSGYLTRVVVIGSGQGFTVRAPAA